MNPNDEGPDVRILSDRDRTARAEFLCDLCKEPIPEGSRYRYVAVTEDGAFTTARIHKGACPFTDPFADESDDDESASRETETGEIANRLLSHARRGTPVKFFHPIRRGRYVVVFLSDPLGEGRYVYNFLQSFADVTDARCFADGFTAAGGNLPVLILDTETRRESHE